MGLGRRTAFLLTLSEILCLVALALSILTLLPGLYPDSLGDYAILTVSHPLLTYLRFSQRPPH